MRTGWLDARTKEAALAPYWCQRMSPQSKKRAGETSVENTFLEKRKRKKIGAQGVSHFHVTQHKIETYWHSNNAPLTMQPWEDLHFEQGLKMGQHGMFSPAFTFCCQL